MNCSRVVKHSTSKTTGEGPQEDVPCLNPGDLPNVKSDATKSSSDSQFVKFQSFKSTSTLKDVPEICRSEMAIASYKPVKNDVDKRDQYEIGANKPSEQNHTNNVQKRDPKILPDSNASKLDVDNTNSHIVILSNKTDVHLTQIKQEVVPNHAENVDSANATECVFYNSPYTPPVRYFNIGQTQPVPVTKNLLSESRDGVKNNQNIVQERWRKHNTSKSVGENKDVCKLFPNPHVNDATTDLLRGNLSVIINKYTIPRGSKNNLTVNLLNRNKLTKDKINHQGIANFNKNVEDNHKKGKVEDLNSEHTEGKAGMNRAQNGDNESSTCEKLITVNMNLQEFSETGSRENVQPTNLRNLKATSSHGMCSPVENEKSTEKMLSRGIDNIRRVKIHNNQKKNMKKMTVKPNHARRCLCKQCVDCREVDKFNWNIIQRYSPVGSSWSEVEQGFLPSKEERNFKAHGLHEIPQRLHEIPHGLQGIPQGLRTIQKRFHEIPQRLHKISQILHKSPQTRQCTPESLHERLRDVPQKSHLFQRKTVPESSHQTRIRDALKTRYASLAARHRTESLQSPNVQSTNLDDDLKQATEMIKGFYHNCSPFPRNLACPIRAKSFAKRFQPYHIPSRSQTSQSDIQHSSVARRLREKYQPGISCGGAQRTDCKVRSECFVDRRRDQHKCTTRCDPMVSATQSHQPRISYKTCDAVGFLNVFLHLPKFLQQRQNKVNPVPSGHSNQRSKLSNFRSGSLETSSENQTNGVYHKKHGVDEAGLDIRKLNALTSAIESRNLHSKSNIRATIPQGISDKINNSVSLVLESLLHNAQLKNHLGSITTKKLPQSRVKKDASKSRDKSPFTKLLSKENDPRLDQKYKCRAGKPIRFNSDAHQPVSNMSYSQKRYNQQPLPFIFSPSGRKLFITSPERSKQFTTSPSKSKQFITSPERSKQFTTSPGRSKQFTTSPGKSKQFSTYLGGSKQLTTSPCGSNKITSPVGSNKTTSPGGSKQFNTSPSGSKQLSTSPGGSKQFTTPPRGSKQFTTTRGESKCNYINNRAFIISRSLSHSKEYHQNTKVSNLRLPGRSKIPVRIKKEYKITLRAKLNLQPRSPKLITNTSYQKIVDKRQTEHPADVLKMDRNDRYRLSLKAGNCDATRTHDRKKIREPIVVSKLPYTAKHKILILDNTESVVIKKHIDSQKLDSVKSILHPGHTAPHNAVAVTGKSNTDFLRRERLGNKLENDNTKKQIKSLLVNKISECMIDKRKFSTSPQEDETNMFSQHIERTPPCVINANPNEASPKGSSPMNSYWNQRLIRTNKSEIANEAGDITRIRSENQLGILSKSKTCIQNNKNMDIFTEHNLLCGETLLTSSTSEEELLVSLEKLTRKLRDIRGDTYNQDSGNSTMEIQHNREVSSQASRLCSRHDFDAMEGLMERDGKEVQINNDISCNKVLKDNTVVKKKGKNVPDRRENNEHKNTNVVPGKVSSAEVKKTVNDMIDSAVESFTKRNRTQHVKTKLSSAGVKWLYNICDEFANKDHQAGDLSGERGVRKVRTAGKKEDSSHGYEQTGGRVLRTPSPAARLDNVLEVTVDRLPWCQLPDNRRKMGKIQSQVSLKGSNKDCFTLRSNIAARDTKCIVRNKYKVNTAEIFKTGHEKLYPQLSPRAAGHEGRGQVAAGHGNRGQMVAGHENRGQMTAGYENRVHITAGHENRGKVAAGHENRGKVAAGHEDRGQMAAGHENRGQMTAGHENRGQMAGIHENRGQMTVGHENRGRMTAGYENRGQFTTGHENRGQMAAGNQMRDTLVMTSARRDKVHLSQEPVADSSGFPQKLTKKKEDKLLCSQRIIHNNSVQKPEKKQIKVMTSRDRLVNQRSGKHSELKHKSTKEITTPKENNSKDGVLRKVVLSCQQIRNITEGRQELRDANDHDRKQITSKDKHDNIAIHNKHSKTSTPLIEKQATFSNQMGTYTIRKREDGRGGKLKGVPIAINSRTAGRVAAGKQGGLPESPHTSPATAHALAKAAHRLPEKTRTMSGINQSLPGRAHTSAGASHTSPGRAHTSPGRARTSPGTSPGTAQTSPCASYTSPGRAHTSPGRVDTSPGRAHTSPGRVHTSPGRDHTSPGRAHTSPGSPHTLRGTTHKLPGTTHAVPRTSHTLPGKPHKLPRTAQTPRISPTLSSPAHAVPRTARKLADTTDTLPRTAQTPRTSPTLSSTAHKVPRTVQTPRTPPTLSSTAHKVPRTAQTPRTSPTLSSTAHKIPLTAQTPHTSPTSPGTSHKLPVTARTSPGTSHKLPVTVRTSPGTSHKLPVTARTSPGGIHTLNRHNARCLQTRKEEPSCHSRTPETVRSESKSRKHSFKNHTKPQRKSESPHEVQNNLRCRSIKKEKLTDKSQYPVDVTKSIGSYPSETSVTRTALKSHHKNLTPSMSIADSPCLSRRQRRAISNSSLNMACSSTKVDHVGSPTMQFTEIDCPNDVNCRRTKLVRLLPDDLSGSSLSKKTTPVRENVNRKVVPNSNGVNKGLSTTERLSGGEEIAPSRLKKARRKNRSATRKKSITKMASQNRVLAQEIANQNGVCAPEIASQNSVCAPDISSQNRVLVSEMANQNGVCASDMASQNRVCASDMASQNRVCASDMASQNKVLAQEMAGQNESERGKVWCQNDQILESRSASDKTNGLKKGSRQQLSELDTDHIHQGTGGRPYDDSTSTKLRCCRRIVDTECCISERCIHQQLLNTSEVAGNVESERLLLEYYENLPSERTWEVNKRFDQRGVVSGDALKRKIRDLCSEIQDRNMPEFGSGSVPSQACEDSSERNRSLSKHNDRILTEVQGESGILKTYEYGGNCLSLLRHQEATQNLDNVTEQNRSLEKEGRSVNQEFLNIEYETRFNGGKGVLKIERKSKYMNMGVDNDKSRTSGDKETISERHEQGRQDGSNVTTYRVECVSHKEHGCVQTNETSQDVHRQRNTLPVSQISLSPPDMIQVDIDLNRRTGPDLPEMDKHTFSTSSKRSSHFHLHTTVNLEKPYHTGKQAIDTETSSLSRGRKPSQQNSWLDECTTHKRGPNTKTQEHAELSTTQKKGPNTETTEHAELSTTQKKGPNTETTEHAELSTTQNKGPNMGITEHARLSTELSNRSTIINNTSNFSKWLTGNEEQSRNKRHRKIGSDSREQFNDYKSRDEIAQINKSEINKKCKQSKSIEKQSIFYESSQISNNGETVLCFDSKNDGKFFIKTANIEQNNEADVHKITTETVTDAMVSCSHRQHNSKLPVCGKHSPNTSTIQFETPSEFELILLGNSDHRPPSQENNTLSGIGSINDNINEPGVEEFEDNYGDKCYSGNQCQEKGLPKKHLERRSSKLCGHLLVQNASGGSLLEHTSRSDMRDSSKPSLPIRSSIRRKRERAGSKFAHMKLIPSSDRPEAQGKSYSSVWSGHRRLLMSNAKFRQEQVRFQNGQAAVKKELKCTKIEQKCVKTDQRVVNNEQTFENSHKTLLRSSFYTVPEPDVGRRPPLRDYVICERKSKSLLSTAASVQSSLSTHLSLTEPHLSALQNVSENPRRVVSTIIRPGKGNHDCARINQITDCVNRVSQAQQQSQHKSQHQFQQQSQQQSQNQGSCCCIKNSRTHSEFESSSSFVLKTTINPRQSSAYTNISLPSSASASPRVVATHSSSFVRKDSKTECVLEHNKVTQNKRFFQQLPRNLRQGDESLGADLEQIVGQCHGTASSRFSGLSNTGSGIKYWRSNSPRSCQDKRFHNLRIKVPNEDSFVGQVVQMFENKFKLTSPIDHVRPITDNPDD